MLPMTDSFKYSGNTDTENEEWKKKNSPCKWQSARQSRKGYNYFG